MRRKLYLLFALFALFAASSRTAAQITCPSAPALPDGSYNVKTFGAKGDGTTDDLPAFDCALNRIGRGGRIGAILRLPPGIYRLKGQLIINKVMIIEGAGWGVWSENVEAATLLKFDRGAGLVINSPNAGNTAGGGNTIIKNLGITTSGKAADVHGVVLRSRARLDNVSVNNFGGNGITIDTDRYSGNANLWYLNNVWIHNNGAHGLYVNGRDANAGTASMVNASENGGWGVKDTSLHGNTYLQCHTEHNGRIDATAGGYTTVGLQPNDIRTSTFIGCYAEGDQAKSKFSPTTVVIGGVYGVSNSGIEGGGTRLIGYNEQLSVRNGKIYNYNTIGGEGSEVGLNLYNEGYVTRWELRQEGQGYNPNGTPTARGSDLKISRQLPAGYDDSLIVEARTGNVIVSKNLLVRGSITKGSGTFLIDHPLDPTHKDLYHGFVEAPRYDLIYRGRVHLRNGEAEVDIDAASNLTAGTFAALTQNVQFTQPNNETGWIKVRVRPNSLKGGKFIIEAEDRRSTDTVSWAVIAERADALIRTSETTDTNGRLRPEADKLPQFRDK